MSDYKVTKLEGIDEVSDGREPWRPVRHHFGIESFGVNAWTGREAGDRIINEHDEADDGDEELYLVQSGRATFELDGERVDRRTTNDYGKTTRERDLILTHLQTVEPPLRVRATHELDASRPLAEIVDALAAIGES